MNKVNVTIKKKIKFHPGDLFKSYKLDSIYILSRIYTNSGIKYLCVSLNSGQAWSDTSFNIEDVIHELTFIGRDLNIIIGEE